MDNNSFAVGYALGWKRGSDSGGGQPSTFDDIISNKIEIGTIYSDDTYRISLNLWWTNDMTVAQCAGLHTMEDVNSYPLSIMAAADGLTNRCYLIFITYENNNSICATICRKGDNTTPYFTGEDLTYRCTSSAAGNKTAWYKQAESLRKDGTWTFGNITDIAPISQGGSGSPSPNQKIHWTNRFEFKVTGTLNYQYRSRRYSSAGLSDWTYLDTSQSFTWDYTLAGGGQIPLVIVSWDCTYYNVPLSELCRVWTQINYNVNRRYYATTSQIVVPTLIE